MFLLNFTVRAARNGKANLIRESILKTFSAPHPLSGFLSSVIFFKALSVIKTFTCAVH